MRREPLPRRLPVHHRSSSNAIPPLSPLSLNITKITHRVPVPLVSITTSSVLTIDVESVTNIKTSYRLTFEWPAIRTKPVEGYLKRLGFSGLLLEALTAAEKDFRESAGYGKLWARTCQPSTVQTVLPPVMRQASFVCMFRVALGSPYFTVAGALRSSQD
jgi:hypothetical protein